MFEIGFWEVALIGVIALLVVGPERLPALARNVGLWVGRIRRYVNHVKQDIEREIHADEVRELMKKSGSIGGGLGDLKDVAKETASAVEELRKGLEEAAREGERAAGDAPGTGSGHGPAPGTAGVAEEASKAARRVPHHAVDEDPFAAGNLPPVAPARQPDPVPGHAPQQAVDADASSTTQSPAADHEQSGETTRGA
jgi:sec-independent protein translocase protein TatB